MGDIWGRMRDKSSENDKIRKVERALTPTLYQWERGIGCWFMYGTRRRK